MFANLLQLMNSWDSEVNITHAESEQSSDIHFLDLRILIQGREISLQMLADLRSQHRSGSADQEKFLGFLEVCLGGR